MLILYFLQSLGEQISNACSHLMELFIPTWVWGQKTENMVLESDHIINTNLDLLNLSENIQNTRNRLTDVSSALTEISVELSAPVVPLNIQGNTFSMMFHQNLFLRNLETTVVEPSFLINRLGLFSHVARQSNADADFFIRRDFLSILTRLDFFVSVVELWDQIPIDSIIIEGEYALEEEKKLYVEFKTVISKYKHIYMYSKRFNYFDKIIKTEWPGMENKLVRRWCSDYIQMINELKEFKKKVPVFSVYNPQNIEEKFNSLKEQISRMEDSLSDLNQEFENMSDLFDFDD